MNPPSHLPQNPTYPPDPVRGPAPGRLASSLPDAVIGPVRVADALAAGVSRGRLRNPSLVAPVRGVRMPVEHAGDLAARCRAIGLVLPDDAAFSHATAAALWRLPLPRMIDPAAPAHVSGPAGRTVIHARALTTHEGIRPDDVARCRDLPVTTVARTWADLGAVLGLTDLVILTDAILSLPYPRTTTSDLTVALDRAAGRRGCRALRRALGLARHLVDSPMETRVRLKLVASGFPCPRVGADLFDDRGCWIARPDLCWPTLRLAIEYDGEHHRTDRFQYAKDIHRKEQMEDLGWRSIVLLSDDVNRRWTVTESRITDAFASRGIRNPRMVPSEPDTPTRTRLTTPRPT
ncbi:endonuclease domain-containing protein [Pengzhenrongella phosphoraccumulans]|uniref:endonuclease domain-containing protein n=1 Tax=Pengzhenrongella phosphoraccumulans TaxID=3114394 RepID=UPI00388E7DC9